MVDMILETRTLPEPLLRLIRSETVRVHEVNGEIRLTPIEETPNRCPLLGMYSDGKLTVDKFLEWKRQDKELEQ
ncbi:MAG: hypothetical protein LBV40_02500 [Methanomicrobiales archaeon]|jgi:hypothetical protein|nr:hypothetical protein [Methanomicrobiales archaeon]